MAVAAGDYHSLALGADGTVWAWGYNLNGRLGDGTTTMRTQPVVVGGLSGQTVVAIAAGSHHSLALTSGGAVFAWGLGSTGQLGNGGTAQQVTPVPVTGLASGVRALAAGESHSVVLKEDGTLMTWGSNTSGQLGIGSTQAQSTVPVAVSGLGPASAVAAGHNHTMAIEVNGDAWAWGADNGAQLGDDAILALKRSPVRVSGLSAGALEGGQFHSLGVRPDGTVWSWGYG